MIRWSVAVLSCWVLVAVLAPWLSGDAYSVNLAELLAAPDRTSWLGRDELGRPVLGRLIAGGQASLTVAFCVVTIAASIGVGIGLVAGYFGGWVDRVLARSIDVFLAFPGILLAIAIAAVLGPGLINTVIALATMGWVGFARLARGQALGLRGREHVTAALALGCGHPRILRVHLLPLLAGPVIVEASFGVANVVIAEAGLSFLGLGVQPPDTSWGSMIRDGVRYMLVAPHLVLAPGMALCAVVFAANLLGDYLRDRLDVRLTARNSS